MASTRSLYKSLPAHLSTALKDFQSSSSTFRLLQTVHPHNLTPQPATPPTKETKDEPQPKTLLILDSSFNPPSTAHQTLATTALHKTSPSITSTPGPHRLLLLFSTMNADKAPSAAPFDQRLTLMTIFAVDLLKALQSNPDSASYTIPAIDIGVTTAPYYSDKSLAITDSPEGQKWYPSAPQHIHLIGFDTLTRFFAPKYYQSFSPPLSALAPYFEAGHRLRATLRPDDAYGSEAEQRAFVQNLADGGLEAEGGKREWAECVELVNATPKAGVSSTVIRKAAKAGEWGVVGELCTEGVAGWVREEGLYEDDAEGKKMG
jgi:nicotinamide-nucleotide adenylyltransferase